MIKKFNIISRILITFLIVCICLTGCVSTYDTQSSIYNSEIEILQSDITDIYEGKTIALPCDNYYCDGKQYTDVVTLFENAGFTNVSAMAQQGDIDKETRVNGSVITVSVENNIIFSKGAIFSPDVEIKIYYVVSQIYEDKTHAQSENNSSTISSAPSASIPEQQESISMPNTNEDNNSSEIASSGEITNIGDNILDVVWVSKKGKKYHNKSSCSGMNDPKKISKEYAEECGYEPCKRCYK